MTYYFVPHFTVFNSSVKSASHLMKDLWIIHAAFICLVRAGAWIDEYSIPLS